MTGATGAMVGSARLISLLLCLLCWAIPVHGAVESNNPPRLSFDGFAQVMENAPVGTSLLTITGTDADGPNELSFKVASTDGIVKLTEPVGNSISGRSVEVLLNKSDIDRDFNGDERTIRIEASDGTNEPISATIILIIQDINDTPPKFNNQPYKASIKEDSTPGSVVFNRTSVTDPDTGLGGSITYSLQTDNEAYKNTFRVGQYDGFIYLNSSLDYEEHSFYQLSLTATDGGGLNTSIDVIVSVIDIQDKGPVFVNTPYSATLKENATIDSNVKQVSALDGDRGKPNQIFYNLTGNTYDDSFKIDERTGWITVAKSLSRFINDLSDSGSAFELTVMASEIESNPPQHGETSASIKVTIKLEDINDHPPQFERSSYSATVKENSQRGIPIQFVDVENIFVQDLDQDTNSRFSVSLMKDGQPYDVFRVSSSIVRSSGNLSILVEDSSVLDYETLSKNGPNTITFTVKAEETDTLERRTGETTVTVEITDENDNFPQFNQSEYAAYIEEHSTPGTYVTTIQATDSDSGNFGNISYQIVRGAEGKFTIDTSTGVLTVTDGTELDREKSPRYFLTVEATDGGGNRNSSQLVITLLDTNDHTPKFLRAEYSTFIEENTFFQPFLLSASDGDEPGTENSNITYSLSYIPPGLNGNFTIETVNQEAMISLSPTLDFEALDRSLRERILLEVTATDHGNPPLSSSVNFTVRVQDKNDMVPVFVENVQVNPLPENAPGDTVVANVTAIDADGAEPNNQIQYSIERGGLEKFYINPSSGEITVAQGAVFNWDVDKSYNLMLVARDKGFPQKSGTMNITVQITDVNNKNPQFQSPSIEFSVQENATRQVPVGTFSATDPDTTASLEYSILRNLTKGFNDLGDEITNQAQIDTLKDYFTVDSSTGQIKVNNQLDRELAEKIRLTVHVVDRNAVVNPESQTATGTVIITLEDFNDNEPQFSEANYTKSVSERENIDYEVITVSASDRDMDQTITFSLENTDGVFYIDPASGKIRLTKRLDRETLAQLSFTVVATDNGVPALSSSANVTITVDDDNDNNPYFLDENMRVNVSEEIVPNNSILTVSAMDKDLGQYANIAYFIETGNVEDKFQLNKTSGELFVKKKLDREDIPEYLLRIEARDNYLDSDPSNRRSNFTTVTIVVGDINDHAPQFSQNEFIVQDEVFENKNNNSFVYRLTATDDDIGENSDISYQLGVDTNATKNISGQNVNLFRIESKTGTIRVRESLGDLAGMKYFTVIAVDNGKPSLSGTATVFVNILDVNNHNPVLTRPISDTISFTEGQGDDFTVTKFEASDADTGINGQVFFELLNNLGQTTVHPFFDLNRDTGVLKTKKEIDFESNQRFDLFIRVTDQGVPPRSSPLSSFKIQILDKDDNPPAFNGTRNAPLSLSISEEDVGVVGQVKAFDKDTIKTDICYCFIGDHGNFELNRSSGVIRLTEKIDRDVNPQPVDLVVEVLPTCTSCDSSSGRAKRALNPPPLYNATDTSLLWVRVNINDINDNKPTFNSKDISVGITRDTQFGEEVLNLAEYVDDKDDATENRLHTFRIVDGITPVVDNYDEEGSNNMFELSTRGVVKTQTYFKANWFGYFSFKAEVKDAAGNSTANVKIYLINQDQQVKIVIVDSLSEVNKTKALIVKQLENATGGHIEIVVDKVRTHEGIDGKPDPSKVDLFIHGVEKSTRKVIPGQELLKLIDSKIRLLIDTYRKFKVAEVLPAVPKDDSQDDEKSLMMAFILVAIILALTLVVVALSFYFCRKKYKRKLRAATAMAFGAKESEMSKMDMPGTNLHAFEGSNPIWMEKYDNIAMDNDSENSLDANEIQIGEENQFDEQEVAMDLYNDDYEYNKLPASKMAATNLQLSAALREHEQAKNHKNKDITNNNAEKYALNGSVKQSNGSLDGLSTFNTTNVNGLPTTEI